MSLKKLTRPDCTSVAALAGTSVAALVGAWAVAFLIVSPTTHAQSPDASDWGFYGGDAFGQHFSSLDQIKRENVGQLTVAWTYRTGELGEGFARESKLTFEATPVLAFGCEGILEPSTAPNEISIPDDGEAASSSSSAEEVLRQYHVPLALLAPGSLRVALAGEGRGPAAARNVTFRVRSGGAAAQPDGAALLTVEDIGPGDAVISADSPGFPRPTEGSTLIKLTGQGDGTVPAVLRNFVLLFHSDAT